MITIAATPTGVLPRPNCEECTGKLIATFECEDRSRIFRPGVDFVLYIGQDLKIYHQKDAVSVKCRNCNNDIPDCGEYTYNTGRILLFVEDGDVFARLENGRTDQVRVLEADITLTSGKVVPITLRLYIAG